MTQALVLKTSLFGDQGQSSALVDTFLATWRARDPALAVIERNLGTQPVPHLDAETFGAFGTPAGQRTPRQQERVRLSDALIAEMNRAEVLVLGLPLYNFGVPSAFKAWIDHVARAGVTFRYGANGPEGLTSLRRAYVLAARGGQYQGTPLDSQTPWLTTMLGFLGIRDVQFVYAEGLARPALREEALRTSHEEARQVAASAPTASAAHA